MNKEEEEALNQLINIYAITKMKEQIGLVGNDKTWEVIERFTNIKTRLTYRKIFFNAGGTVPKTFI